MNYKWFDFETIINSIQLLKTKTLILIFCFLTTLLSSCEKDGFFRESKRVINLKNETSYEIKIEGFFQRKKIETLTIAPQSNLRREFDEYCFLSKFFGIIFI